METCRALFETLAQRRRKLGISYAALARRSGVSMPTVVRLLSGRHLSASLRNVVAVADALGVDFQVREVTPVHELREQQAAQKAQRLTRMLQGTSGLEAQALDRETVSAMTRQTVHELLAGSPRKL